VVYGPDTRAQAANLACGHHVPVARAAMLLRQMAGIKVSTGWRERFRDYEDLILRFVTDLAVTEFTNNEAERSVRPVKVQQHSSGGCWRTLEGLAEFATVQSYLSTAAKWRTDALDALRQLFTTGLWLPPALTPDAPAKAA
jgi:hypothetical protein